MLEQVVPVPAAAATPGCGSVALAASRRCALHAARCPLPTIARLVDLHFARASQVGHGDGQNAAETEAAAKVDEEFVTPSAAEAAGAELGCLGAPTRSGSV